MSAKEYSFSSVLLSVPGLIKMVLDYLSMKDEMAAGMVCRDIHDCVHHKTMLIRKHFSSHRSDERMQEWPDSTLSCEHSLHRIYARCTYKDQGWGNRKGQVLIQLMREDNKGSGDWKMICKRDLFGIAKHDWSEPSVLIEDENDPLIQQAQKEDKLRVVCRIGGGGGHSLEVRDLLIAYFWKSH